MTATHTTHDASKPWGLISKATGDLLNSYPTRGKARDAKTADTTIVKLTISMPSVEVPQETASPDEKPKDRKGSKKEQARAIYEAHVASGRAAVIAALTDPNGLGLSAAGASTYYYNLKNGKW